MKKSKVIALIIVIAVLVLIYFSFLPIVTPDSSTYYEYLDILKGKLGLDSWNVTRGPAMPLILYIFASIFGDNANGFLIGTFIFYLVLLFFAYKIIKENTKIYDNKITNFIIWFLYILVIVFNPLIIGYYHTMLTEFVATTVSLISCYLSYKFIKKQYKNEKISFLIYTFVFSLLAAFMWFLKQPYITTIIFPLLISVILSIIRFKNLSNVLSKSLSFLFVMLFVLLSTSIWNKILISNDADSPNNKTQYFLSEGLVNGVTNYRRIDTVESHNIDCVRAYDYLTEKEKQEIIKIINNNSKYKDYKIFNVLNGEKIIDRKILFQRDTSVANTKEAINFIFNSLQEHPLLLADSYFSNYFATIDVYQSYSSDYKYYYPIKSFEEFYSENKTIGLASFYERPIYWWAWSDGKIEVENMKQYEVMNTPNETLSDLMLSSSELSLSIFKIVFLIAPLMFIYLFIKYLSIVKKKDNYFMPLYEIIIILFGFSFMHILLHAVTGALIDRYASVAYPAALIGSFLLLKLKSKKKNKFIEKEKNEIKGSKVLFVIPAYNEELNIGKVIDEINRDVPNADIVVINDYSKDNTIDIVEEKGVYCITMPFNVKYAKAVQTGIKYAEQNSYDYVIQFDADGQHIAKETDKLIKKMKEENCDIVIGSRFLKKNDYKHSFFRKIGTKVFSIIIYLFCREKITDPTSGFQCLNRKVIECYAQMGKYPEFPDANLIIEMILDGYSICEVPVVMRERKFGESMHGGIIKPIKYMIKILYSIVIIFVMNMGFEKEGEK